MLEPVTISSDSAVRVTRLETHPAFESEKAPTAERRAPRSGWQAFTPATIPTVTAVETRPYRRTLSPRGSAVAAVLIALGGGMIGAWAYAQFSGAKREKASAERALVEIPVHFAKEIADLRSRFDDVGRRVAELSTRLDAVASASRARFESGKSLSGPVTVSDDFASVPEKVRGLDGRLTALEKSFDSVMGDRATANNASAPVATETPQLSPAMASSEGQDSARPLLESWTVEDEDLTRGALLFKQAKYQDAYQFFDQKARIHPNDARIWYFAALSYGFAKNEWADGQAETLVRKGIERERAGTPTRAKIDAAFRDLTTADGKDWLVAYRRQVAIR